MIYKKFYSELGKLLYAVADIDGVITSKEKEVLQNMVKKDLAPAEKHTDEAGTSTSFYTEIEFDFLDEQISDPDEAFQSFIDFVEEHSAAFDERLMKASFRLAETLAHAYHGTNKKERELIERLKHKLNQIELKKSESRK